MTNEPRVRHAPLLGATTCFFNVCARLGRRVSASRVSALATGFSGHSFVFHFSCPARPKVGHEFSWLDAFLVGTTRRDAPAFARPVVRI